MKPLTVTIGIPAHNEEQSIGQLLGALAVQKENEIRIKKIFVVADGCTDNTVSIVNKCHEHDKRVTCVEKIEREGKTAGINTILSHTTTDILIFIDADVSIATSEHISRLCAPFLHDDAVGITAAHAIPEPAETMVESAVSAYHQGLSYVYRWYRNGDIIYSATGCSVALRTSMLPDSIPNTRFDDAFWYLWMKQEGKKYVFIHDLPVYFRNPQTIADVRLQQARYGGTITEMSQFFHPSLIRSAYHIPVVFKIYLLLYAVLTNPIGYMILKIGMVFSTIRTLRQKDKSPTWHMVNSTKKVTIRTIQ